MINANHNKRRLRWISFLNLLKVSSRNEQNAPTTITVLKQKPQIRAKYHIL